MEISGEDESFQDKQLIFFLYHEIDSVSKTNLTNENSYEYYLFFPATEIDERTQTMTSDLLNSIFTLWLPIFVLWSGMYILFCYWVIRTISRKMLRPIIKLTYRIHKSVHSIRSLREKQDRKVDISLN